MKFNLLSRAALGALVGASDAGAAIIVAGDPATTTNPEPAPADPAPEGDPPPATTTAPADPTPDAAAEQQVVTVADATAIAAQARTAEIERTAAVFASAEALANPQMAAWMLQNSPAANAEGIIAQLKTLPAGTAASKPAPVIADTNIDLGRGDPAAALGLGADAGSDSDPWAASNKRCFGADVPKDIIVPAGMTVGASDSNRSFALGGGAGLSLSTPTAGPRPTGN